jgi:hypothetical protein
MTVNPPTVSKHEMFRIGVAQPLRKRTTERIFRTMTNKIQEKEPAQSSLAGLDGYLSALTERQLGIKERPGNDPFSQQLAATPFGIFRVVHDFGCYAWRPPPILPQPSYRSIGQESMEQLRACIVGINEDNTSARPPSLVDLNHWQTHKLPYQLEDPNQYWKGSFKNQYPYDVPHLASLHVMANSRDQGLKESGLSTNNVHFVLGGSGLDFLARCRSATSEGSSSPRTSGQSKNQSNKRGKQEAFLAYRIPETEIICIKSAKSYTCNMLEIGHQVEALVTEAEDAAPRASNQDKSFSFIEHVQLMAIDDRYRVMFSAEVDAATSLQNFWRRTDTSKLVEPDERNDSDENVMVEVKSGNPKNWGTKTMFQMISSGSAAVCAVERDPRTNTMVDIKMKFLSEVTTDALSGYGRSLPLHSHAVQKLETSILSNLKELRRLFVEEESGQYPPGTAWRLDFNEDNSIRLSPRMDPNGAEHNSTGDILPSSDRVIRDLLATRPSPPMAAV